MITIGINDFIIDRHFKKSEYSYYDGTPHELVELCEKTINGLNEKPAGEVYLLDVDPIGFYSSLIEVNDDTKLHSYLYKRRSDELSYIKTVSIGDYKPAKFVKVVLYSYDNLRKNNEQSTDCDWEIVSINAQCEAQSAPMHPVTMMRNHFDLVGGTSPEHGYTADQFAESILYWSTHVNVIQNK